MKKTTVIARSYLFAQLFFWGSYCLINIALGMLWGINSLFVITIFIVLSLLLGAISHLLRYCYHRYSRRWSLLKTGLHLLWLLPVAALLTQFVLHLIIYGLLTAAPALTSGVQPVSAGSFLGYSMNTFIMLVLWSILYLLRAEFIRRRHSEVEYWRAQAKLNDIELQFLRSQINSHFLFNALNNLRALILEDAQAARQGLADLATLLRGLLHAEAKTRVPLREELEWVRGYLALEALQFEARLQYEFVIEEGLLSAEVPPLLLQTLVENAVKHGIAARRTGGTIYIAAKTIAAGKWQLNVKNPPPDLTPQHQGNGIGLANARERLRLAFGTSATLELTISDTITVIAELPYENPDR